VTGVAWWHFGYQPRHRSTREDMADADWHTTEPWDAPTQDWDRLLDNPEPAAEPSLPASEGPASEGPVSEGPVSGRPVSEGTQDFVDQLTGDQLRQVLEGCALDDVERIVRPLVKSIAHSSHTATTLASAWSNFQRSTRDAYALHVGASRWWDFFKREELGSHPAEDAVELKLREADDAWWLITNGV
jgi:hypothetical protein